MEIEEEPEESVDHRGVILTGAERREAQEHKDWEKWDWFSWTRRRPVAGL
ncbi:MAG: hypothetical protein ACLRWQ_03910 [Flavonifractor plautii]